MDLEKHHTAVISLDFTLGALSSCHCHAPFLPWAPENVASDAPRSFKKVLKNLSFNKKKCRNWMRWERERITRKSSVIMLRPPAVMCSQIRGRNQKTMREILSRRLRTGFKVPNRLLQCLTSSIAYSAVVSCWAWGGGWGGICSWPCFVSLCTFAPPPEDLWTTVHGKLYRIISPQQTRLK